MASLEESSQLLVEAAQLSEFMEVLQDGDNPRWWLTVDQERLLMIESDPESGDLVLTTEVLVLADLPEETHLNVLKQALAYNALWSETGGGRMSLLGEEESLQLMVSLPEKEQEISHLCRIVNNLLERAEDWAAALSNLPADQIPQKPAGPENLMPV
jgi:hypothetical protein